MTLFSYFLIAATLAAFALAAVLFTDPEPGRHAASKTRMWPLFVAGAHVDKPVLETPAEVTFRVGSEPEAVSPA